MKNLFTQRNLIIVLATLLGFFGFLVAFDYGLKSYNQWKGEQGVESLKKALEKMEEDAYQKMMADTYGGKTPEETLDMFISAVEKGDYELASRYFVVEKQEEELESLKKSKKENIHNVMKLLKDAIGGISKKEPYWESHDDYVITEPILIRFIKYPNGVWKIIEI